VAVAEVEGMDGLVTGFSKGNGYHSEQHILDQLEAQGISPSRIRALYSEREPCNSCGPKLAELAPEAQISYSVPWGQDRAIRQTANDMLADMIRSQ
jgi:hypothetical protein